MAVFFLTLFGAYLALGLVFAIPFVLYGVNKIDSHAANGSWGFRLIILPGVVGLWPLLMMRWRQGAGEPPEEQSAHRNPAESKAQK